MRWPQNEGWQQLIGLVYRCRLSQCKLYTRNWLTCTQQSVLAAKLVWKSHHQWRRHQRWVQSNRRRSKEAVMWRHAMERVGHIGHVKSRVRRSNGRKIRCRHSSRSEERKWRWWRWKSSSSWQRAMRSKTIGRTTTLKHQQCDTSDTSTTNRQNYDL